MEFFEEGGIASREAERRLLARREQLKRIVVVAAAGVLCAAGATAYFFFPAGAEGVFKSAVSVIAQSWNNALGSPPDGGGAAPFVIALGGEGTSSEEVLGLTGADAAGTGTAGEGAAGATYAANVADVGGEIDAAGEATTAAPAVPLPPPASSPAATSSVLPPATASAALPPSVASPAAASPPPAAPSPAAKPEPCVFAAATLRAPTYAVLINEIAWMGSPPRADETASQAANREWIELKNAGGAAASIAGWQLEDASGKLDIVLGNAADPAGGGGALIPARGFYLLERGGGPAASGTLPGVDADQGYAGALSNDGDALVLFDRACNAVDRADASSGWLGGDNATKQTLERNADGYGWHTSAAAGGTPKAENSAPPLAAAAAVASSSGGAGSASGANAVAAPASTTTTVTAATTTATATTTTTTTTICIVAQATSTAAVSNLVVAEIQIAGGASDNDFVKLFNPTAAAVDVSGWKLRKKSKSGADYSLRVFPDGSAVAPGGYFAWANASGGFGGGMGADVTSTETLAADNSVALFDVSGALVDAVAWGEGAAQYVEGAAYPANPEAGQVLKRKSANGAIVDTDNNADDFAL